MPLCFRYLKQNSIGFSEGWTLCVLAHITPPFLQAIYRKRAKRQRETFLYIRCLGSLRTSAVSISATFPKNHLSETRQNVNARLPFCWILFYIFYLIVFTFKNGYRCHLDYIHQAMLFAYICNINCIKAFI